MKNIGFSNFINESKIVSIIQVDSAPARRLIKTAREQGNLIDGTQGRATAAIIVMNSDHVVLSSLSPEKIASERNEKC
jgi:hypothetical protein